MTINPNEAAAALGEIDDIARRVRQSLTYQRASLMMIVWGVLTFAGYVITFAWPHVAIRTWLCVDLLGIALTLGIGAYGFSRNGVRAFDRRIFATVALFISFGIIVTYLGHFGPRELSAFWPLYFMSVYIAAGLWVGIGFVVIGYGIAALTLIGYFFIGGWFDLWMAFVNGGGLVLGGLWMRRD